MDKEIKILIADDHSVVRQGVTLLLKQVCKNISIAATDNFTDILKTVKVQSFDMIILDISIPEGKGIKMIEFIRAIIPKVKILIFSAYEEDLYALRYLKAGADGYLNKLSSEEEFKLAFLDIVEKGRYVSDSLKKKIEENPLNKHSDNPLNLLSKREMEIACLLVKGEGNLEIANRLNLQNSTVSTYKNRIFEKLFITNTIALVALFRSHGDE